MKTGRSLNEVMVELSRQNKAKKDYIGSAEAFHLQDDGRTFEINHIVSGQQEIFDTTQLFHRQVAATLGIPAKYYDMMAAQKPGLLVPKRQRMVCGQE
jgi:4-hydroxyphenylpyruvate dioxygenase-like putative hemolysin